MDASPQQIHHVTSRERRKSRIRGLKGGLCRVRVSPVFSKPLPDHTNLSERKPLIFLSFILAGTCKDSASPAVNVASTLGGSPNFSLKQLTSFFFFGANSPDICDRENQKSARAHKSAALHFSSVFHYIFFSGLPHKFSTFWDGGEMNHFQSALLRQVHVPQKDALLLCVY